MLELCELGIKRIYPLDSTEKLLSVETIPRGGDDNGIRIMLAKKLYRLLGASRLGIIGMGENYSSSFLYLVDVELSEVLHIHTAFINVSDGSVCVYFRILALHCTNGTKNVGELPDTRGLDKYSLGVKLIKHLPKRCGKIADEGAADTTRIHFGYLDARLGEKAAVNSYFTKLVFNKHNALAAVCLLYQLLYKRGLSGSEKAGKNIYFRHLHV